MRSTAFTSALAVLLLSGAALAEGPGPGCYARDYTAEHLASHPEQVVARMRLEVLGRNEAGETEARLSVVLARQGRAEAEGVGGRAFAQRLACRGRPEGTVCGVECDGGVFAVGEDERGLALTTDRLRVGDGDGCGGDFDLAERPGEAVTYRLERAAPGACGGS